MVLRNPVKRSDWVIPFQRLAPYAVKDSWEDEERPEESLLLKKVTEAGAQNVVEYHYHETVRDGNVIVDIRNVDWYETLTDIERSIFNIQYQ